MNLVDIFGVNCALEFGVPCLKEVTLRQYDGMSPEIKLSILKDEFTLAIYHNMSVKVLSHPGHLDLGELSRKQLDSYLV